MKPSVTPAMFALLASFAVAACDPATLLVANESSHTVAFEYRRFDGSVYADLVNPGEGSGLMLGFAERRPLVVTQQGDAKHAVLYAGPACPWFQSLIVSEDLSARCQRLTDFPGKK